MGKDGSDVTGEVDFKGTANFFFLNWMLSSLVITIIYLKYICIYSHNDFKAAVGNLWSVRSEWLATAL